MFLKHCRLLLAYEKLHLILEFDTFDSYFITLTDVNLCFFFFRFPILGFLILFHLFLVLFYILSSDGGIFELTSF